MFESLSRRDLLKKVQEADFLALDLQLYLDTHPDCYRALKLYTDTVKEAKELREEYEQKFGPLTADSSPQTIPWEWAKNPWTWERG